MANSWKEISVAHDQFDTDNAHTVETQTFMVSVKTNFNILPGIFKSSNVILLYLQPNSPQCQVETRRAN